MSNHFMSNHFLKSFGVVLLAALLVGCGATRVSYTETPLPAFLVDENVTMVAANNVWRLQGGESGSHFVPTQARQVISNSESGCDDNDVGSVVLTLGVSLVDCSLRSVASNVRGITEWSNYRQVLRLGSNDEVPHYRVQIEAEGRQFHGLLAFNNIPEEAGTNAPRSYQVTLHAGGKPLPKFGNVRNTYGRYNIAKFPGASFASWMLWYSDIPLN